LAEDLHSVGVGGDCPVGGEAGGGDPSDEDTVSDERIDLSRLTVNSVDDIGKGNASNRLGDGIRADEPKPLLGVANGEVLDGGVATEKLDDITGAVLAIKDSRIAVLTAQYDGIGGCSIVGQS